MEDSLADILEARERELLAQIAEAQRELADIAALKPCAGNFVRESNGEA